MLRLYPGPNLDVLIPFYLNPTRNPDRYHNLLCQVVGRKYIRIYSHASSEGLYPYKAFPLGLGLARVYIHTRPWFCRDMPLVLRLMTY